MALSEDQVNQFYDEGYLLIPDFAHQDTITTLRSECHRLVDEMNPDEITTVFSTNEWLDESKMNSKTDVSKVKSWTNDEYFLRSGNNISYFFEDGAKDENGRLLVEKHKAINKMGHVWTYHVISASYFANASSRKLVASEVSKADLTTSLGMVDPMLIQSMYIFKPPRIGTAVNPHQDSTFLNTSPMKLIGFWLALEDTTEDNGCLWFIPKSHKEGLYGNRRFIRVPKGDLKPGEPETKFIGDFVEYDPNRFVAGPVKKGTMVLIHGEVVHKSEKNVSDKSREIYTFHMYDSHNTKYNTDSWLQPSETFERLLA